MANDKHRDPLPLRQLHQRHGTVLHLSHAAGGCVQFLVIQGLDRIHNQDVGLLLLYTLQHITQPRFGQDKQVFAVHTQALCPQLQLTGRLLAGYIQHLSKLPQLLAYLQHQGRFADTGCAAHQHQRPLHRTAAQHAVQFTHSGGETYFLVRLHIRNARYLYRRIYTGHFAVFGRTLRRLLHHGIPCAAHRAASGPARTLAAALGAEKHGLSLHISSLICTVLAKTRCDGSGHVQLIVWLLKQHRLLRV